jgi:hypothetical protein
MPTLMLLISSMIAAAAHVQPASEPAPQTVPGPQIQPADEPAKEPEVVVPGPKVITDPAPSKPAAPLSSAPAKPGTSNDPAVKSADDLLRALETADRELRTLQSDISWDKTMEIQGDQQVRLGRLVFQQTPAAGRAPQRAFEIRFDKLMVGGRLEDQQQIYIFSGEWLIEKQPKDKLMIRRQVAPPGQFFDPLRVGEGPLPIPIGQKRDDILSRFTAELVPPGESIDDQKDLVEFAKGTIQVKLKPLPELEPGSDFKEIRLWYLRAANLPGRPYLPRMVRTRNEQGDVSIVRLINMKLNQPLPSGVMDTKEPDGWQIQTRLFREGE